MSDSVLASGSRATMSCTNVPTAGDAVDSPSPPWLVSNQRSAHSLNDCTFEGETRTGPEGTRSSCVDTARPSVHDAGWAHATPAAARSPR